MLQRDYRLLDSKLFKAFMAAAETENFTSAARKAFMTQSGVSQHIAKLEEQIGVPLFKRVGKRVVLTDAGQKLMRFVKEYAYTMETFLDELRDDAQAISGLVSYAMPASCLLSPHFPLLLQKRLPYPDLTLDVTLVPSEDVVRMVLDDQIDFGFVTHRHEHPSLDYELFCREEYILVGSDPDVLKAITPGNVCRQRYITYPGADVYFDLWLRHHFPARKNLDFLSLTPTGNINSIDGAIKMVVGGLGISVFPRHCVEAALEQGDLFEFSNSKDPLLNDIYFLTITGHAYPKSVRQVLAWFREMHCEAPPAQGTAA